MFKQKHFVQSCHKHKALQLEEHLVEESSGGRSNVLIFNGNNVIE